MNNSQSTIEEVRMLLKYIAKGYDIPKILYDTVWNVALREIEDKQKVVLIKRDPDVERGRMQASYVKIIEGSTMDMHPAAVGPFGADFDGDTMGIFVPISEEAQKEARSKMISATRSDSINSPNFELSNEMFTGLFTLTLTENVKSQYKEIKSVDDVKDMHVGQRVIYNGVKTTAGRVMFNAALPEGYPYQNRAIDKKAIKGIMKEIIESDHSKFVATTDKLMDVAFHYATVHPLSYGQDMMANLSPALLKLKADLGKEKEPARQSEIIDAIEVELLQHLKDSQPELYGNVASGGSKGTTQIRQLMVCKGLIGDPDGNVLPPITQSIGDGYSPSQYFDAAAGARKGTIDRALNTAHGGYSFRKILFCASNVELNKSVRNCETKSGLTIKLTKDIFNRMRGRYVIGEQDRLLPIDASMIGRVITIRSPIFCKTNHICPTCFGELHKQLNTTNIGICSAQEMNISEKIMKSFHTGGQVNLTPVNIPEEMIATTDDDNRAILAKLVHQTHDDLILDSDYTMLKIKKSNYQHEKMEILDDTIKLPVGYFELDFPELQLDITIEQPTIINYNKENMETSADYINISYSKDDIIFRVEPMVEDYTKVVSLIDKYIGGRSPWGNDPNKLYMKFAKSVFPVKSFDSVHIEILISNIIRNKTNPQKPARIVLPYDPALFSVKSLPSLISWPLGLAFENFGKSIQSGMISDRGPSSPVEKILFGESLIE